MSTSLLLLIAVLGVVLLLLMVIKAKVQPFVALLVVSLLVALASGYSNRRSDESDDRRDGRRTWFGDHYHRSGRDAWPHDRTLGRRRVAGTTLQPWAGAETHTVAALTLAAFILGVPVFFDVGFIILAPIIYGFAKVPKCRR